MIRDVRLELHKRILALRSIESILDKEEVARLWERSDEMQRAALMFYINLLEDKGLVLEWIKKHPAIDISDRPIWRLKEMAARLRIKNYSRMDKRDLVAAITWREQQYVTDETSSD